jgi:hypothetical protein
MSDDAQNSTTIIPYRTGVRPLHWDFTRTTTPRTTPPRPHSLEALFTNPDPRLRPRESVIGPQMYFIPLQQKLAVTQWNFPEIHEVFTQISQRLGVSDYRLSILPNHPDGAVVRYRDKEVLIGANFLNSMTFDSVHWLLGHELGHAWRNKNPDAPQLRSARPMASASHAGEIEADIVSLCMHKDHATIMRGMKVLRRETDGAQHPSRANRIASIEQTPLYECISMLPHIPPPGVSPYLATPKGNKKARE